MKGTKVLLMVPVKSNVHFGTFISKSVAATINNRLDHDIMNKAKINTAHFLPSNYAVILEKSPLGRETI